MVYGHVLHVVSYGHVLHVVSCIRTAFSRGILAIYHTPLVPYCLSKPCKKLIWLNATWSQHWTAVTFILGIICSCENILFILCRTKSMYVCPPLAFAPLSLLLHLQNKTSSPLDEMRGEPACHKSVVKADLVLSVPLFTCAYFIPALCHWET